MYKLRTVITSDSGKVFDIRKRSFLFSVQVIQLVTQLPRTTAGFAIGNQVIRSGTSVGANIEETQNSGTKKEFVHTFTIALKEARETEYWLRLIIETNLISDQKVEKMCEEIKEIIKILTVIIKKTCPVPDILNRRIRS